MDRRLTYAVLAGALLLVGGAPALVPAATAQVVVTPDTLRLSLPAGQAAEVALEAINAGGSALRLFAVPLPEEGAPEDVGALLFHTEPGTVGDPQGLAMTPEGRLFAATYGGGPGRNKTAEYTADLALVRRFDTPRIDWEPTSGLAWMPPEHAPGGAAAYPEGTLWWLQIEGLNNPPQCPRGLRWARLIEGDLDGQATGRRVELPLTPGAGRFCTGVFGGLAYDAETRLFYYLDAVNEDVYAIDVTGQVPEDYPVPQTDYDPGEPHTLDGYALDALRGEDGGAYLDVLVVLPGDERYERVVVTDRWGRSTGVETPLGSLTAPDGEGPLVQVLGVLRSRLDPSVLYLAVYATQVEVGYATPWLYAIRAHPLPPRWLRVAPVAPLSLEMASGAADTLTVKLDTERLAVGTYEGQVALRRDSPNGEEVVAVPVVLTVTEGTATEAGPQAEALRLGAPYPNPARGPVTVPLALAQPGEVRVAVYDVLGREVAVLLDGPLGPGEHAFRLDASALPAGLYVVRASGGDVSLTRRVVLTR